MGSGDPIDYRLVYSKFRQNYGKVIFQHYVIAPIGVVVVLFFAYLTDLVIDLLPFTFPAQAICMILLFAVLVLLHWVSPHFLFHHVHNFLHPAAEFLLACMGLFFTSSFILIPRRDAMPGKEIGLITALFLPSFLITWVGTVAIVKAMERVWPRDVESDTEEDNNADVLDEAETGSIRTARSRSASKTRAGTTLSRAENGQVTHRSVRSSVSRSELGPSSTQTPGTPNLTLDRNITLTAVDESREKNEGATEKREFDEKDGMVARSIHKLKQSWRSQSTVVDSSLSAEERLALRLEKWFDPTVYLLVFLIGIPLFFTPGGERRSLPLFTGTVSLAWLFSKRAVPVNWQKLLHPILVTSVITVLIVWVFGAIKGISLTEVLNHYSTGATYLILFRRSEGWDGSPPSAGDLLTSLLVGGIVVLAFPMFRYRFDLYNNFFRLIVVIAPNVVVSLLFWPWLAHKMGMAGDRAITFAARFMSTPFGIQFIVATGGDNSLVVVLICITGIFAVLVRDYLFKLCRTRTTPGSDEYFTIGCTIGIIAAAIGTSSLMVTHSRAAATSTVTFVVYGLVLLALVAVPSISNYVGKLSGL